MTNTTPLSRPQLLARLAGERGHLLWSLIGMDETLLTHTTLHDDWKIKDIFPHVGRWDETFAHWIALTKDGQSAEIRLLDDHPTNQAWHEQHKDFSLEQGCAVFLKARGGFWASLERLTDEEIDEPITLTTGRVTKVRRWIAAAYQHDAEHAAEIWKWRQDNEFKRAVGPLFLVRALVRATRKEFLSVAANVPEEEKGSRPVCGVWTLQDVVGHIADWEAHGVAGIQRVLAGEDSITNPFGADIPAWNDAHAAARKGQSWDQVWHDYQTTRQNFFYALDQIAQEQLSCPLRTPWGDMNLYRWINIWTAHEREHAADLRRELALPDTPDYLLPRH